MVSWKGEYEEVDGGANGTRTRNPLLAKQVRYQLRHGPFSEEIVSSRRFLIDRISDLSPCGPLHASRLEPEPRGITGGSQEQKDRG